MNSHLISKGRLDHLEERSKKLTELEIKYEHRNKRLKQCSDAFDNLEAASEAWEGTATQWKTKHNEMQLVAGRWQYQFEHAQKAINRIDDMFEYEYLKHDMKSLQIRVHDVLAQYTEAVTKVTKKGE